MKDEKNSLNSNGSMSRCRGELLLFEFRDHENPEQGSRQKDLPGEGQIEPVERYKVVGWRLSPQIINGTSRVE